MVTSKNMSRHWNWNHLQLFIKAYRESLGEVQQVFKRYETTTPARCCTIGQVKWIDLRIMKKRWPEISRWIFSLPTHFLPLLRYNPVQLFFREGKFPKILQSFLHAYEVATNITVLTYWSQHVERKKKELAFIQSNGNLMLRNWAVKCYINAALQPLQAFLLQSSPIKRYELLEYNNNQKLNYILWENKTMIQWTWAGVRSKEGRASPWLPWTQTHERPRPNHAADPATTSAAYIYNFIKKKVSFGSP